MRILKFIAFAILVGALPSCSGGEKEKGATAQAKYEESLRNSLNEATRRADSCENQIKSLRAQQDEWINEFTTVSNPREAASYMIFTSCQKDYPPKGTGLIARMADNAQFELIASLSGGRFNQITVESGAETVTSGIVPADQALNYMVDGLNVVLFTGPEADAIGKFIADNELNNIRVIYQNGKATGTMLLSTDKRNMIMRTYQFYAAQREINHLERMVSKISKEKEIIKSHMEPEK